MMPISMNLRSKRDNTIKSLTLSIRLTLTLVAAPAFGTIEWGFDSYANPYSANIGSGSAAITVGSSSTGWHDGPLSVPPWNSYGTAQGFWDLGQSGSIVLSPLGNSTTSLQVFQFVDTFLYTGLLTYQINGVGTPVLLTFGQITQGGVEGGPPGSWQQWNATFALNPGDYVTITAPSGGAIIDRMALTVVPEPGTVIAGALLLLPFALSTIRVLRRNRAA